LHLGAPLEDGRQVTPDLFRSVLTDEMNKLRTAFTPAVFEGGRFAEAIKLFSDMSLAKEFEEFLTLPAYKLID
jgi:malate synthase